MSTGAGPSQKQQLTRRRALGLGLGGAVAAAAGSYLGFKAMAPRPLNVVFIIADALRSDHLGCNGYRRPVRGREASPSPNIDRLAAEGALFETCVAPSSWTLPSVAAIMASRHPFVEGELYNEGFVGERPTTAQILRRRAYETVALQKNMWLYVRGGEGKRDLVAARGFQRYLTGYMVPVENPLYEQGIGEPEVFKRFANAREATEQAFGVLRQLKNPLGPFFLYIHYMDTHEPYNPPEEYKRAVCTEPPVEGIPDYMLYQALRTYADRRGERGLTGSDMPLLRRAGELYDAGLHFLDHWIGRLAAHLKAEGLWENTLLVLTADHGEEFAEHSWIGHSTTLYRESLRVPLIFAGGPVASPRRCGAPVRSIDIAPTILAACGLDAPATMQGRALDICGEESGAERCVSSLVYPGGPEPLESKIYSIGKPGRLKFIRTEFVGEDDTRPAESELYDLRSDPGEQHNLAGEKGELVAALSDTLGLLRRESSSEIAGGIELDEETRRRLRSVGYLH